MANPLMAELVRRAIDDGVLLRLIDDKRGSAGERQALARRVLAARAQCWRRPRQRPASLDDPADPWTDEAFAARGAPARRARHAGHRLAIGRRRPRRCACPGLAAQAWPRSSVGSTSWPGCSRPAEPMQSIV